MTKAGPGQGYGVLRIGDRLIGVPFGNLAEVCVVQEVSKLMAASGPLLGAFDLRGFLVPLVDVEALCGLAPSARLTHQAAVLQHDGRVTAIALDEIVTLTEAEPTETRFGQPREASDSSFSAGHGQLFPGGFVMDGRIVSCLDAGVLFSNPEAPSIANTRTAKPPSRSGRTRKYLVFAAGGARFGVDAEHISATVPRHQIDTSEIGGDGGLCLGFIEHHGWKVPVVHTNMALGLGDIPDLGVAEIVVLRFPGDKLLGLAVESTESLSSIPEDRMNDSGPLIAGHRLLPKVHVTDDGVQVYVVDTDVLTTQTDLQTISDLAIQKSARQSTAPAEARGASAVNRESMRYLVFEAGCTMAVPAEQVARILHRPKSIVRARNMPAAVKGFFPVADKSVPLVSVTDEPADQSVEGFVLLVSANGRQVGFTANRICSMQTSQWRIKGAPAGPDGNDLVQVRDRGETTVLPVADLAALAHSITELVPDEPRAAVAPS